MTAPLFVAIVAGLAAVALLAARRVRR